jgi:hypothetical protein
LFLFPYLSPSHIHLPSTNFAHGTQFLLVFSFLSSQQHKEAEVGWREVVVPRGTEAVARGDAPGDGGK